MAEMRPAAEMKDSGIEWIGQIPCDWKLIPNKYLMHKEKDLCAKWTGQDVMSLTMNGVIVRDLVNPSGKMPESFDGYQFIKPGDLLMCLFDIDVTPRCVGRVYHEGVTSPAYSNFKLHDNASLGYYYYYYLMLDHTKELLHLAKNLRHSFTAEQLGQLKVPLPSYREQQAIADYLDDRCSKIDEIIAEATASIEEYKNYRESIISNATTRGITNNREMKDSGINWLPKIPKEWETITAKALFVQRKDRGIPGEKQLTASQNLGIIYQEDYMRIQGTRLMVVQKDFDILKHVEPDDFVISMRSFQGGLEYSYLRGCISSAYVMLIPNHEYVHSEYYKWLFKSDKYINALQSTSDLIRDGQALRYANFVKLRLFKVPLTEQKEIADYLNDIIPKVDALISEKQSLISDLQAYKKSLIYEVVTGKRRVV